MQIVVSLGDEPMMVIASDRRDGLRAVGHVVESGVRDRSICSKRSSSARTVGAVLLPGATQTLFGIPASEISNRCVSASSLGINEIDEFVDAIRAIPSVTERIAAFERFLAHVPSKRVADGAALVRVAREEVIANPLIPCGDLATELGVSERTLRRSFSHDLGVSPKRFARIARLQRLLRTIESAEHSGGNLPAQPMAPWTRAAIKCGYSDQSHMIHDFRELTGMTPENYACARRVTPSGASLNHVPLLNGNA